MKRLLVLAMVLGLTAFETGVAKANLLGNPDLDVIAAGDQTLATPVGGWHVSSAKSISGPYTDGASSETFCNVLQPGGTGLFFKAFAGNVTTGDLVSTKLYQDTPASAGMKYSLTGWAGAGGGYIGLTDPTVKSQFALQFLDGSNAVLASSTIDLVPLGLGTSGLPNPFGYNTYTVTSGVAPAGTVVVRSIAQQLNAYGNPAGGDQAYVVDSFDLEKVVPEPASIVLGMIAAAGMFGLVRRRS
jgi:PEP-CTERM motif